MVEARDMRVIGIPFAAGAAAGAVLIPAGMPSGSLLLPSCLAAVLLLLSVLPLSPLGKGLAKKYSVPWAAVSFCLAGVFCYLNGRLSAGTVIPPSPLEKLSLQCCESLKGCIDSIPYPSEGTGALVKALITGDRTGLDKGTIETFRASGASHILALSGLHLGIIYLILTKITIPFGNSPAARTARYSFIIAASGFYAIMTGAAASITRAFLFILIGETGKLLGREREPWRVLLDALVIQLALKPEVISTTGFQLSYLAMLGICTIFPVLEGLYPEGTGLWGRIDPVRKTWNAAALSLSCQAFTAPLVWIRFHTFPQYFLLTNLIALPLTSAIMVLSVTTIALSFLGICPDFLVCLDDQAVGALTFCLEVISSL
ncbi:MAG: ComEC/Rec2 family competence protein [Bacteroidales bacterium]|nr:ComEC/Rec2 family competence protein [Bacteroidales bacterium]